MHTPIVCGTLMALGIATAERAQTFIRQTPGCRAVSFSSLERWVETRQGTLTLGFALEQSPRSFPSRPAPSRASPATSRRGRYCR